MPFDLLQEVHAESKLELARRIHAKWRELAPRDRVPEAVAISNRLGDLERDRPAWWSSEVRPAARRAFEQVTGVLFQDLPLARDVILSPDFPRLRPFRPHDEAPLVLGTPNWFVVPGPWERRWIVAPAGAGRSFVVQWHHLRGAVQAREVPRLIAASELFGVDAPIVIGVDALAADDEAALSRLVGRKAVLVIAPFAPPGRLQGPPVDRSSDEEAQRQPDEEAGRESRWSVEEWRPVPGWRNELVGWIAGRIDDRETLLDAAQLLAWLERVDPRCETFATPGDVVALSAFAYQSGVPSFRRNIAERFLDARLRQEAAQAREGGTWLRTWGVQIVKALADARLQRFDLPLWGPLDRSTWADLLPADLAPRVLEESEIDKLLDRKRTPKREARNRLLRRPAPEAIELMFSSRLLRAQAEGLSLHPRWVVLGFARAGVQREVTEGTPSTWGRWAVDVERRQLVDAELDELPLDKLVRISVRVVSALDKSSLGTVGAVEAVFAALGRRFGLRVHAPDELHALWEVQRSLLIARYTNMAPLAPRTRPGFESRGEWIACCWSWSLYGPKAWVDDSEAWLFPGWCRRLLLEHLALLDRVNVGEPGFTGRESPAELERLRQPGATFTRLLEMAFEIIPRCQDPTLPRHLPAVLIPAIVLAAHRRAPPWVPTASHIRRLTGSLWGSAHLVQRARALPADDRVAIARTIWSALVGEQRGAVNALDHLRQSALLDFIEDHLPVEDFAEALSLNDDDALARLFELPIAFRLPLVRYALEHHRDEVRVPDFALEREWGGCPGSSTAGAHDAPWIELLADARPSGPCCQALWRVAPERALERALAGDLTEAAALDWFQAAPRRFHPRLLDRLASAPRPLPDWAVLWLRHRVLEGGADADRAYLLTEP